MLRFFETLIDPTRPPAPGTPPRALGAFFWHHIRQIKGPLLIVFLFVVADGLLDTILPWFMGKLVTVISNTSRENFFAEAGHLLIGMAAILLVIRPLVIVLGRAASEIGVAPGMTYLLRWQHYVLISRQSLNFFQRDFAGRLANRVMQTGGSVRMAVLSVLQALVYVLFYVIGAVGLLLAQAAWLAVPTILWVFSYLLLLRFFIPRMQERSRNSSFGRSMVMGKLADSFGNAQTVKLFATRTHEDNYIRDAMREAYGQFQAQQRLSVAFTASLTTMNALMMTSSIAISIWLWQRGSIEVGAVAMTLPLVTMLVRMSGWISWEIAGIFENVGVVQEGTESISVEPDLVDRDDAKRLIVPDGGVRFENVSFGYGKPLPVLDDITLDIRPGEKVGLIGRSGAGKSTLINLLLRFYDIDQGRILIDGQDIAGVDQESLRQSIAVVTQDTALLHRSIAENIRYGRRNASDEEVRAAARRAHADAFIDNLEDWKGHKGYEALVGERGVKLSGGQRQRIAIARVILKNAPILVLDEATSALDSEVEAAIQESLVDLMEGKTVIAIAHRLSTLQIMDRLIVLDKGRIIEEGTHASLLEKGGLYAELWARQSGGFLIEPKKLEPAGE